jgi:hypothetical protein
VASEAPLLGSWRAWYAVVLGALAVTIAGLALLSSRLS